MANNKVQLADGTVLIDLTDTTATASDVASGSYFYDAAGVKQSGTLVVDQTYSVTKTLTNVTSSNDDTKVIAGNSFYADLTPTSGYAITSITVTMDGVDITDQVFASGIGVKEISANGSYVASSDGLSGYKAVSVNVPNTYTAGDEGKVVSSGELVSQTSATYTANNTYDTTLIDSVTVAIPSGSATTPATSITANPSISVGSDGLITATTSASQSVTPTVSAGYVSSGTAGTVSVSGSATSQMAVQAAQTIHPSTSAQTITSGKYLTGTQTIAAVTLENLTAGNIKKDVVVKIGDADDDDCIASVTGTLDSGVNLTFVTHATVASEVTLRAFLQNNPIPLVYKSGCVYICFNSSSTPTQGSRTYGSGMFVYRNSTTKNFVTWSYKNSLDAPSNVTSVPSASNGTYYNITNKAITGNSSTPNTFYLPVGTVVQVCHIPLDWMGRKIDTTGI